MQEMNEAERKENQKRNERKIVMMTIKTKQKKKMIEYVER